MSLQYSNNISIKRFISKRPWVKAQENKGRFSFYYTNPEDENLLPVITQEQPDTIQFFHWGLIPSWIKGTEEAMGYRTNTLIAKSETIFKLPTYRGYIKRKRCLIPATGFIVWHLKLGVKYPLLIMVRRETGTDKICSFCFGGVYSTWVDENTGEVFNTFSMITTKRNDILSFLHNSNKRMPLILLAEDEQKWLQAELSEEEINQLMQPYPNELIKDHTISRRFIYKDAIPNVPETLLPFMYKNMDLHIG